MTQISNAPTLVSAWKAAQARLKAQGIDSPSIDARLLLEAATGASRRSQPLAEPLRRCLPCWCVRRHPRRGQAGVRRVRRVPC